LLIRLTRALPEGDEQCDPADQDVDDTAGAKARTGQEMRRLAV
jgi:hypothetical protein